jgi:sterol desaturase/sphingolipid hydroxylase (fatty acid hydroxylase superfamily)
MFPIGIDIYDLLYYGGLLGWAVIQWCMPRERYGVLKTEWKQDLLWFLVAGEVVPRLLAPTFLDSNWISARTPALVDFPVGSGILKIAIALVVSDFMRYWIHRSLHVVPVLWDMHKSHHSSIQLTAISGARAGLLENLIAAIMTAVPLRLMGLSLEAIAVIQVIFALQGQWVHANVNFGWRFSPFLCTPNYHRWHHAAESRIRGGQNFGVIFPFWDRLFGTEYMRQDSPKNLGFEGMEAYPTGFFARLFYPLQRLIPAGLRRADA